MNQPQQNYQPFLVPYQDSPEFLPPRPLSTLMIVLAIASWLFSAFCAITFLAYGSMAVESRMDSMGVAIVQNQCIVGGFLSLFMGFLLFRLRRI